MIVAPDAALKSHDEAYGQARRSIGARLDGWRQNKLLDFFQLQRGFDLPIQNRHAGTVPVIASNGQVGLHNESPITSPAVITGRSGTIGRVIFSDSPCWPLNTTLFVSDFKGSDPLFVYYFLSDLPLKEYASGTGVPTLNRNDVHAVEVSFPPFDEQRRIAEVLRSADEAIASQSAVRDQLAKTFNQLVEACFSEVADAPRVPLGEVCQSIQVGIVIRPASYYVSSGGIPALRSLNVRENRLDLNDMVYISAEGHRLNGKSSLRPGDVVTRRTGEPGKSAVIPAACDTGLNCIDIIFSRPKDELRSLFLSFFMNSDAAKRQVSAMQGGLAQQHLNVGEMKKLKVPLPPLERQDEVVAFLSDAWDHLAIEEKAVRRLSSLKSGLASDLLSGRVRVPA